MAKFSHQNLLKPTPKKIRRLGNSLFLGAQAAAALALVSDVKWLGISLVIAGFLGKFISEFFGDDTPPPNTP